MKRAVFEAPGHALPTDAILATNTSYIDPRLIADGLPSPARIYRLHFFSPAQVMKLLEIVPITETSRDVLATAFESLPASLARCRCGPASAMVLLAIASCAATGRRPKR